MAQVGFEPRPCWSLAQCFNHHYYDVLGCKWHLRCIFWNHIEIFFHENLGDVSDEHGKRFHQDVAIIEKRFKGKFFVGMFADYYWSVKRLLNCCINNQDVDCRTFLCCFTVSNSIHFCIFDIINLSLFCHYFCQAICDCIVQYVVTLRNDVEYSDPCTRDVSYAKHSL